MGRGARTFWDKSLALPSSKEKTNTVISQEASRLLQESGVLEENLIGAFPEVTGLKTRLQVLLLNKSALQIRAQLEDEAGTPEITLRRSLDFKEGVAYHNSFEILDPAKQGKGLGLHFFLSALNFYKDSGINKIELHAGGDVGGYFWARLGFFPPSKKSALVLRAIVTRAATEVQEIIWRLESLEERAPHLGDLREVLLFLESTLEEEPFPVAKLAAFAPKIEAPDDSELFQGQSSPYSGKSLLLGSGWSGTFDLESSYCRETLAKYLTRIPREKSRTLPEAGWLQASAAAK